MTLLHSRCLSSAGSPKFQGQQAGLPCACRCHTCPWILLQPQRHLGQLHVHFYSKVPRAVQYSTLVGGDSQNCGRFQLVPAMRVSVCQCVAALWFLFSFILHIFLQNVGAVAFRCQFTLKAKLPVSESSVLSTIVRAMPGPCNKYIVNQVPVTLFCFLVLNQGNLTNTEGK